MSNILNMDLMHIAGMMMADMSPTPSAVALAVSRRGVGHDWAVLVMSVIESPMSNQVVIATTPSIQQ